MGILYGIPLSTFTRKVRIALAEKGIAYELREIAAMGRKAPELLAMNPLGRIPVYATDGIVVPDSSVIIAYLERAHPARPLYPAAPAAFARALFLEEYADTRLREASATFFFERTIKRLFQQQPPNDKALVPAARIRDECFHYLESVRGGADFLAGDAFSVADVAVAAQLVTLEQGGEVVDAARWPQLADYARRIFGRASIAPLIAEEAALLSRGQVSGPPLAAR